MRRFVRRFARSCALVLLAALLLAACSPNGTPIEPPQLSETSGDAPVSGTDIALITTEARLEAPFGQAVREAVSRYAGESGRSFASYKSEADDPEAALATLELAITSGAVLVVSMDEVVSRAVAGVASLYSAVSFILLDAKDIAAPSNTVVVGYNTVQAAWLAGYVAMQEQQGTLGLVSLADDDSRRCALGFMLGAEAAAAELELDGLRLLWLELDEAPPPTDETAGSDGAGGTTAGEGAGDTPPEDEAPEDEAPEALTPRALLEGGAGVVFAAAGALQQPVLAACAETDGRMIGLELGLEVSGRVLASVQYEAAPLVYSLLGRWGDGRLPVGERVVGGVADGSVVLVLEYGRFEQAVKWTLDHAADKFSDGALARRLAAVVKPGADGELPGPDALGLERITVVPPWPEEDPGMSEVESLPVSGPAVSEPVLYPAPGGDGGT